MKHYVVLLNESGNHRLGVLPGLEILEGSVYQRRVKSDDGYLHTNLGNFDSDIPPSGLVGKVCEALGERVRVNGAEKSVHAIPFDPKSIYADVNSLYLLSISGSLIIYFVTLQETLTYTDIQAYSALLLQAVEKLLQADGSGSVYRTIGKLKEQIRIPVK